jgi:hypothetical protein
MSAARTLVAALFLLLLASAVSAATYYVDINSGDNGHTTLEAQNPSTPWKNISYALGSVESGSVVRVAAGRYSTFEGEASLLDIGAGITLSGESSNTVTIEGRIGDSQYLIGLQDNAALLHCLVRSFPEYFGVPGPDRGQLVRVLGQGVRVDDNIFRDLTGQGACLHFSSSTYGAAAGNVLSGGTYGVTTASQQPVTLEGNTIAWCSIGLRSTLASGFSPAPIFASGNIISARPVLNDLSGTGITGNGDFTLDRNCVWGNTTNYGPNVAAHLTDINAQPRFLDSSSAAGDFRLFSDSPCIGAGPGGANIGAYQGSGVGTSNFRATVFVSGAGSDSPRLVGGTESSPWRSITYAANYAEQELFAKAGVYNAAAGETFPLSFVYLRRLRGESPAVATIEGAASQLLTINNPLTIEGFTLINADTNPDGYVVNVGGSGIRGDIIGNRILWAGAYPAGSCGVFIKASQGYVSRNELRNLYYGVAAYNSGGSGTATVENNTIVKCRIGVAALNDKVFIKNNIISNNPEGAPLITSNGVYSSGEAVCSYNDVYLNAHNYLNQHGGTGATAGPGSISAEALFYDVANDDYRLRFGSPCIAAGEGGLDLGAYPYVPTTTTTPSTTTSTAVGTTTTTSTTTTITPIPAGRSFSPITMGSRGAVINLAFSSRISGPVRCLVQDLGVTPPQPLGEFELSVSEGNNLLSLPAARAWTGKLIRVTFIHGGSAYSAKCLVPALP